MSFRLYDSTKDIARSLLPRTAWEVLRAARKRSMDFCQRLAVPWKTFKILNLNYGHWKSVWANLPVDGEGRPIPWYTYPAIEYLRQLDFRQRNVFEYGCGHSTLFWGEVAREVVSVEMDSWWHNYVASKVKPNTHLHLVPDLNAYIHWIDQCQEGFDVIIIDGFIENLTRLECCRAASRRLKRGGLLILDNAEWLPRSCAFLRGLGLIEVNLAGFAPIGSWVSSTSLFFHREFDIPVRNPQGSFRPIGGWALDLESGAGPLEEA